MRGDGDVNEAAENVVKMHKRGLFGRGRIFGKPERKKRRVEVGTGTVVGGEKRKKSIVGVGFTSGVSTPGDEFGPAAGSRRYARGRDVS